LVRGIDVLHIMSLTTIYPHKLTAFAQVDNSINPPKLYYPASE
jgi:hypothetical protein